MLPTKESVELQSRALKFAASATKRYVGTVNPDIIQTSLASNALAHGYYQGAEQKPGLEALQLGRWRIVRWIRSWFESDELERAELVGQYCDLYAGKFPGTRGDDRRILRNAYREGFHAGLQQG